MPLLFCLGQHPASVAVSAGLREGERLFAYLDDLYIVCRPERGLELCMTFFGRHLWQYAVISLHAARGRRRCGVPARIKNGIVM